MQKLSKDEMKNVKGGLTAPGCYMCCWDDRPTICSACTYSYSTAPCTSGASPCWRKVRLCRLLKEFKIIL